MKKLILFIKIVILSNLSYSQVITNYNTSNTSIPTNNIRCFEWVGQDLYIGTSTGLIKYDGSTWTTYNTTTNPTMLPGNSITSMKYSSGILLVGTTSGLSQMENNVWTTYTSSGSTTSLSDNNIKSISASSDTFLISTQGGIVSRKIGSGSIFKRYNPIYLTNYAISLSNVPCTKVLIDKNKYSFFNVNGYDAIAYNNQTTFAGVNQNASLYGTVVAIDKDVNGNPIVLTVGSTTNNLSYYNFGSITSQVTTLPLSAQNPTNIKFNLFVNKNNNDIWISYIDATNSYIAKYDGSNWTSYIIGDKTIAVTNITVDPSNNNLVYASTSANGIYKLDFRIPQTITTSTISNQTYGIGIVQFNYSISSNRPLTITTSSNISVSGNNVFILGAGLATITLSNNGDANYFGITKTITFNIDKANQDLQFGSIDQKYVSDIPFEIYAFTNNTITTSISYSIISGNAASINGNIITINNSGSVVIRATSPGDNNYNSSFVDFTLLILEDPITGTINKNSTLFNMYPNPSNGSFKINSSNTIQEVTLVNIVGVSEVIQVNSMNPEIVTTMKGMIIVLVRSNDVISSSKIVIE